MTEIQAVLRAPSRSRVHVRSRNSVPTTELKVGGSPKRLPTCHLGEIYPSRDDRGARRYHTGTMIGWCRVTTFSPASSPTVGQVPSGEPTSTSLPPQLRPSSAT